MAEPVSAWGIDIGQAGLKAMKLRVSDDGERVIAAAFDYIPHPKILSQPDAIPEELIREAMKTFLDRNKIEDDLIAISVPGQSSLAKFIKLPPVADPLRFERRHLGLSAARWRHRRKRFHARSRSRAICDEARTRL